MHEGFSMFRDPLWWIIAVVMGFVIGVIAAVSGNYLTRRFDRTLGSISRRWKTKSGKQLQEIEKRALAFQEHPEERAVAAARIISLRLRSIEWLVFGVLGLCFGILNIELGYMNKVAEAFIIFGSSAWCAWSFAMYGADRRKVFVDEVALVLSLKPGIEWREHLAIESTLSRLY